MTQEQELRELIAVKLFVNSDEEVDGIEDIIEALTEKYILSKIDELSNRLNKIASTCEAMIRDRNEEDKLECHRVTIEHQLGCVLPKCRRVKNKED